MEATATREDNVVLMRTLFIVPLLVSVNWKVYCTVQT
ncbi:hypothetical protein SPHV1_2430068 [Novosphingobium sp. KN65.2]|nr:hypothetical protein SPHV1_2430068 [Novosphingobium sp. KN65.2]